MRHVRGKAVSKSWDRLPACRCSRVFDRLEAYPTNQHGLFHSLEAKIDYTAMFAERVTEYSSLLRLGRLFFIKCRLPLLDFLQGCHGRQRVEVRVLDRL